MSSSVENRPGQRQGNPRRRRGGSSGEGNRRPRSRSGSSSKGNLDPRRRMEESKARRKEVQAPPSIWQKLMGFFTGKPVGGAPDKKSAAVESGTKRPRPPKENRPRRESKPVRTAPSAPLPDIGQRIAEVSSGKLYIGNLSYDATEENLNELFGGIGNVDSAEVVSHRRTQRSKGYAFVHMATIEEAKRAVEILHDKDFMGRKLIVSGARSAGEQDDEDQDQDDVSAETGNEVKASADPTPAESDS